MTVSILWVALTLAYVTVAVLFVEHGLRFGRRKSLYAGTAFAVAASGALVQTGVLG